jgi:hypothetical protein
MTSLFDLVYLQNLCKKYQVYPSKKYGQNFLINPAPIEKMLEAAMLHPDDTIIEIGPGFGVLTLALAQQVKKIYAFEIELNVRLLPGQSDDPLWREKVDVLHNAYYAVKKRRPFNRAPEKIAAFVTPLPNYNCIAVGTTKTSIAKFWAGVGALHRRGDSYIETVLSPNQLEHAACSWEPMRIAGLTGKNFNRVRILND